MADAEAGKGHLYNPRKCSWTKRLITAYDYAAVQINIGNVTDQGVYDGSYKTVALCGYIRDKGESDRALRELVAQFDKK